MNTYRYKLSDELNDALSRFSTTNMSTDRHEYKSSFELWVQTNQTLVNNEIHRLTELGFDGDVIDKMYKSARYYHIKPKKEKPIKLETDTKYKTSKRVLSAMDQHIKTYGNAMKPSIAFIDFCNRIVLALRTVEHTTRTSLTEELTQTLKKTYKNRYNRDIARNLHNGHPSGTDTD